MRLRVAKKVVWKCWFVYYGAQRLDTFCRAVRRLGHKRYFALKHKALGWTP